MPRRSITIHGTTILAIQRNGSGAIGGDGQVTLGATAVKHDARKIRRLAGGKVICGFSGSAADSFALLERFEAKLKKHHENVRRAATELARDWRTDRLLRRLEAMIVILSAEDLLMLSGMGDVIESSDGVVAVGSGGMYAAAAAKALLAHTDLPAARIVEDALKIAGEICIYTNQSIIVETI